MGGRGRGKTRRGVCAFPLRCCLTMAAAGRGRQGQDDHGGLDSATVVVTARGRAHDGTCPPWRMGRQWMPMWPPGTPQRPWCRLPATRFFGPQTPSDVWNGLQWEPGLTATPFWPLCVPFERVSPRWRPLYIDFGKNFAKNVRFLWDFGAVQLPGLPTKVCRKSPFLRHFRAIFEQFCCAFPDGSGLRPESTVNCHRLHPAQYEMTCNALPPA